MLRRHDLNDFNNFIHVLQVQDVPTHVGTVPDVKNVQFELSKESLQTMLDGLNKIRSQLSAIK
jgi:hypothetical protein